MRRPSELTEFCCFGKAELLNFVEQRTGSFKPHLVAFVHLWIAGRRHICDAAADLCPVARPAFWGAADEAGAVRLLLAPQLPAAAAAMGEAEAALQAESPMLPGTSPCRPSIPARVDQGQQLSDAPSDRVSNGPLAASPPSPASATTLEATPALASLSESQNPDVSAHNGPTSAEALPLAAPAPTSFPPAPSPSGAGGRHEEPPTSDGGAVGGRPSLSTQGGQLSLGAHAEAAIAAMTAPPSAASPPPAAAEDAAGPSSSGPPVLVFINSKSGGRLGPRLMACFQKLLGNSQVFDLSVDNPRTVLAALLQRLDAQRAAGNTAAAAAREAMRILVCGGDGTVGWVLASLEALHLARPPPLGVLPLGTGNDLARTFGWGASFTSTKHARVAACLERVAVATPSLMDNWQVELFPADAAPLTLPHALHPHQLQPASHLVPHHRGLAHISGYRGGFWNYFSLGMDAHTAYAFHHLRERKPWLARGRHVNQAIYAHYGCAQGWFCLPCTCSGGHGVSALARIQYSGKDGQWHALPLAPNVRAVVVLNLQSYAGGRDPWGRPSRRQQEQGGFVAATVDDGLLEVVTLTDGWHTAAIMAKATHARRLVQAHSLLVELHGERAPRAYMQMDGEPWVQPCDPDKPPAILYITHSGQSVVLATKGSKVRSSTLGQTVPSPEPQPVLPVEVVERAAEQEDQRQEKGGEVELVQQEEEEAVQRAERKH